MINQERLKDVLIEYKQDYVTRQWKDEKYKWEAVKWFQDHWDVNASEFADMLDLSLDKTYNLLASRNSFPRIMIVEFARVAPEQVTHFSMPPLCRKNPFFVCDLPSSCRQSNIFRSSKMSCSASRCCSADSSGVGFTGFVG